MKVLTSVNRVSEKKSKYEAADFKINTGSARTEREMNTRRQPPVARPVSSSEETKADTVTDAHVLRATTQPVWNQCMERGKLQGKVSEYEEGPSQT